MTRFVPGLLGFLALAACSGSAPAPGEGSPALTRTDAAGDAGGDGGADGAPSSEAGGTDGGHGEPAQGSDPRCPPVYWLGCNQPCDAPGLACTYPDEGDSPGTPAYAKCFPDTSDAGTGAWRCTQ